MSRLVAFKARAVLVFWYSIATLVLCLLALIAAARIEATDTAPSNLSFGPNGVTETRCIDGLRFVIGEGGNARQVLDGQGRGIACDGRAP